MSGRVILGDMIMGVVLGGAVYFVLTAVWPALNGPVLFVLAITGCAIAVLFREPGGALYRPGAAPFIGKGRRTLRRIGSADLASITISPVLLKALGAWVLGAVVLAVLAPVLHANGLELRQWMAWTVMLAVLALVLGRDVAERCRTKR